MTLFIVRRAEAGDRAAWTGDDRERPLTASGHRRSAAIAEVHAAHRLDRILSSPARRCVDTVAPIAVARRMDVVEDEALAEGAAFDDVDLLLHRCASGNALLCAHGDVMDAIGSVLSGRHLTAASHGCPKGTTWVLDTWPDTRRLVVLAPDDVG